MGRRGGSPKRKRKKTPAPAHQQAKGGEATNTTSNSGGDHNPDQNPVAKKSCPNTDVKDDKRAKKDKWWADPQIILGICNIALASVLAFATWGLLLAANDQIDLVEDQIEVARDSIKEAKRANDTTRESINASQRAWMTVDEITNLKRPEVPQDALGLSIVWRNTGNSPVIRARYSTEFGEIEKGGEIPVFDHRKANHKSEFYHLAVDGVLPSTSSIVPADMISRLESGRSDVILYARLEYQDSYSGNEWRVSEVTMRVSIKFWTAADKTIRPTIEYHMVGKQNHMN